VASGKGGVGKSTVAVNLACALACGGSAVGILDADVYGPNIPLLMGVAGERPQARHGQGLLPVIAHGVKLMSIGFLVDEATPMVWRGPLLHTTVRQFLSEVSWGELDYLVVDLPPGTGDVAISLGQSVPLTGAVVVTTPQTVSVADVLRCIAMFQLPDVAVPVLGVIENMSGFVAPDTGRRYDIFGVGGGRSVAERTGVAMLGEVPIDTAVRESGDAGIPVVVARPESAAARALAEIAGRLAGLVSVRHKGGLQRPAHGDPDLPIVG
jgi:ATP-binding protein involved in chromosome partitioning